LRQSKLVENISWFKGTAIFQQSEEAIRIIEVSEKLEIEEAGQNNLLVNGDMSIYGNAFSFEKEMNYFDVKSKSKNIYLKMFDEDQIIELEGLLNDAKDDVTARTYGKLKREMIAKSDERHVEEDMFVGENLEGRREPKTKRSRN